ARGARRRLRPRRGLAADARVAPPADEAAPLLDGEVAVRNRARLPFPCLQLDGPFEGGAIVEKRKQVAAVRGIGDSAEMAAAAGEVRTELLLGRRLPDTSARAPSGREIRAVRRERDRGDR